MTRAIEKAKPAAAAKASERVASNLSLATGFDDRIIDLVRATVCPDATPLELACFLYNAKRLGLDPMTRQIYFIKYSKDKPGEIVVGINGYRAQADSSEVYAGSDPAEFDYSDAALSKRGFPTAATVTVWKIVGGQRVPFAATVKWKEFYPGDGPSGDQWRKRPENQLSVRAESHALRKGFPQQTERLEVQRPPTNWEEAALADARARNAPEKISRDSKRYEEIFGDVIESDKQQNAAAAAIVEQAHAAAAQRDEDLDEIEAARQRDQEGLL